MANTVAHSPARIVRQLLIDLGLGVASGTGFNVFYDGEPDRPDDAITIRVTDGTSFGSVMNDGELQGNYGFQVRIRATDSDTGWSKADEIQTALAEGVYERTVAIGTARYLIQCFSKIGDVLPLGLDKPTGRRHLFVMNADATINQLT